MFFLEVILEIMGIKRFVGVLFRSFLTLCEAIGGSLFFGRDSGVVFHFLLQLILEMRKQRQSRLGDLPKAIQLLRG